MAYTNINKSSDYFNTVTWTGSGSKITTGLRPDLLWLKSTSSVGYSGIVDVIRGNDNYIQSYDTAAQTNYSNYLTTDNTGFTPSAVFSSHSYVGFSWLAGGTGVSNTDGTITSTVSANNTSGFSIVKYTGNGSANQTVGHGLSTAPKFLIIKPVSGANDWFVGHSSVGFTKFLKLNATQAATTNSLFGNTAPTTSVFSIFGTDGNTNSTGIDYIAYCFSEVKGYSKFGAYTPSSSAGSIFVYTGFKPLFTIIKPQNIGNWWMHNWKSQTYNENGKHLKANLEDAQGDAVASVGIHSVSNGFYINAPAGSNSLHSGGEPYIYMCWAEHPLVSSTGTPCTAR